MKEKKEAAVHLKAYDDDDDDMYNKHKNNKVNYNCCFNIPFKK